MTQMISHFVSWMKSNKRTSNYLAEANLPKADNIVIHLLDKCWFRAWFLNARLPPHKYPSERTMSNQHSVMPVVILASGVEGYWLMPFGQGCNQYWMEALWTNFFSWSAFDLHSLLKSPVEMQWLDKQRKICGFKVLCFYKYLMKGKRPGRLITLYKCIEFLELIFLESPW